MTKDPPEIIVPDHLKDEQERVKRNKRIADRQALCRMSCAPKPGWTQNPLLTLPRNGPCPCESGRKFKKCCLPDQPRYIREDELQDHLDFKKEWTHG
jgi:hypothetical protein